MPAGRVAELAGIAVLATVVTLAIAAPLLRAPTTRVFGMDIVGRHHDAFTVMEQIAQPLQPSVYSQPVTDAIGRALARVMGPVAGYNALVLLSFPLSAVAAYLLARHLRVSRSASAMAAMAFAFSPFHLAHAAYHPQIAQTQWVPLYLLALWRCMDAPSPWAMLWLGAATLTVTLSNFYGGLIAAVITPVAVAAYALVTWRDHPHPLRRLAITTAGLAAMAIAGLIYIHRTAPDILATPTEYAFVRDDLFRYSAKWWSYVIPPVAHPWLGAMAARLWIREDVSVGLLEQQVYLGWSLIALGLVAIGAWMVTARQRGAAGARVFVPALVMVAITALVCSLSPERQIGAFTFTRPSALLYAVAPMFRSYARFGVVVQLMAALLAAIGLDAMRRAGSRAATAAALLLVAMLVGEYSVAPSAMSRDVLPTSAHRWVVNQPAAMRVLDCAPLTPESGSVRWLTNRRVELAQPTDDCTEPEFAAKLAAEGYTHLLVRRRSTDGDWFATRALPDGFRIAQHFVDADVFTVTAPPPTIYTAIVDRFSPREFDAAWSWRWMGADASWTVRNTSDHALVATAAVELAAFHNARRLELWIDGRRAQALDIHPERQTYAIGPVVLSPGAHLFVFHPVDAPTPAGALIGNGDTRALSFALGNWRWTAQGVRP